MRSTRKGILTLALFGSIVASFFAPERAQAHIIESDDLLVADLPWSIDERSLSRQLHHALALYANERGAFDEKGEPVPSRLPDTLKIEVGTPESHYKNRFVLDDGIVAISCAAGRPQPVPYEAHIIPFAHSCRFQLDKSTTPWSTTERDIAEVLTKALEILYGSYAANFVATEQIVAHEVKADSATWMLGDIDSSSYIKCERRTRDNSSRCAIRLRP